MARALWIGFMLLPLWLAAQTPSLRKYIPGHYLSDNLHQVEIFNPSPEAISLEGYMLVTRDYSVLLPASARVPAGGTYRIAKDKRSGIHLALSQTKDFLIRFHFYEHQGYYIALFTPQMKLVEAVYMGPSANVPFLPDRDTCITFDGRRIPFYLPAETRPEWRYVPTPENASGGIEKQAGTWVQIAAGKKSDVVAVHRDLEANYRDGIMYLGWKTAEEQDCKEHWVERSTNQSDFVTVGKEAGAGTADEITSYSFLEKGLKPGQRYYYRIRSLSAGGQEQISPSIEVEATERKSEFEMEVTAGAEGGMRIRFTTIYSQRVRIQVYDDLLREEALLFHDFVYAGAPTLVVYEKVLQRGKRYLVIATTDRGRFDQTFTLGN